MGCKLFQVERFLLTGIACLASSAFHGIFHGTRHFSTTFRTIDRIEYTLHSNNIRIWYLVDITVPYLPPYASAPLLFPFSHFHPLFHHNFVHAADFSDFSHHSLKVNYLMRSQNIKMLYGRGKGSKFWLGCREEFC